MDVNLTAHRRTGIVSSLAAAIHDSQAARQIFFFRIYELDLL
jgi:hypothetical protein